MRVVLFACCAGYVAARVRQQTKQLQVAASDAKVFCITVFAPFGVCSTAAVLRWSLRLPLDVVTELLLGGNYEDLNVLPSESFKARYVEECSEDAEHHASPGELECLQGNSSDSCLSPLTSTLLVSTWYRCLLCWPTCGNSIPYESTPFSVAL
jgi:hypothetical protein